MKTPAHRQPSGTSSTLSHGQRAWRWTELVVLFVLPPIAFRIGWAPNAWFMPSLLLAGVLATAAAHWQGWTKWHWPPRRQLTSMLWRTALLAPLPALLLGVWLAGRAMGWWLVPAQVAWLTFVRAEPSTFLLFLFLYPALSVLPQEGLFRAFFFARYRRLCRSDGQALLLNAVLFAWAHLPYRNGWALFFCFFGGLIFARTWLAGRGLVAVCLEHSFWGVWLFFLGWGWCFSGARG